MSVIREFEANITSDFKNSWLEATAADEGITINEAEVFYGGTDLDNLHKRIAGKRVTLTENEYPVGDNDFFEKEDNNFVMHHNVWVER